MVIQKIDGKEIYKFTVQGKIDSDSMEEFNDLLKQYSESKTKIKLIGLILDFPGFEDLEAFTETLKVKFNSIGAIGKYAVLTDREWLQKFIPIGDFLTPGMPLKGFELGQ